MYQKPPRIFAIAALGLAGLCATEAGAYTILGLGGDSCASYTLAVSEAQPTKAIVSEGMTYYSAANAYTQWLAGFLTAASQGQNQADFNAVAMWVERYCEKNPSQPIAFGAGDFIRVHHLLPAALAPEVSK